MEVLLIMINILPGHVQNFRVEWFEHLFTMVPFTNLLAGDI
jgi:hypothetical protein